MLKKIVGYLGVMSLLLLLSACADMTHQTIYNVNNQSVPPGLTTKQVEKGLETAAVSKGWNMHEIRPGLMLASISVRSHYAQVSIPFNRHSYSIIYKKSTNLDAEGGKIHRNYNKWVILLNKRIMSTLHHTAVTG